MHPVVLTILFYFVVAPVALMLGGNLLLGGADTGVIPWTGKAYFGALCIQLAMWIAAGKKD